MINAWKPFTEWVASLLGGPARARVILLLASALALGGADLGAVGSMAAILQHQFSIDKAHIGYLIAASQGAQVFSTLFFGWLVDRTQRTRVLAIAILLWGAGMLACGAATSFTFLLIARVGLGAVSAATLPCTASLIGDYFPGRERGKIYGYIISGEMVGTGVGFVLSGETASLWWRLGFWVLLLPALPLAWAIARLPEPERGGQSRLAEGHREATPQAPAPAQGSGQENGEERLMGQKTREAGVEPRARLVREEDPGQQSVWWAVAYVLSIPTNLALIIGSALGYAFFADLRTFGLEYLQAWFHLGHSSALWLMVLLGLGALAGVWVGGHLGDRLLARGHLPARVWVATGFFWVTVGFFFLAFWLHVLWLCSIFFLCSSFALGGVNPPLDSARLDIMHPKLWGRAESVRSILRNAFEAIAPVTFGWLVAGFGHGAQGLHYGFLIMLLPLAIAGGIGFITFGTYPADAAAAETYTRRTMHPADAEG